MRLKNKVAVITGGNSGIGLGIAQEFKKEGASIVIMGRDRKSLDAAQLKLGNEVLVVQGDVTKFEDLENLYNKTMAKFGKLDVLVANAGVAKMIPFESTSEDSFDLQFDINVKGVFFTVQKALPHLNDGASVILISSTIGHKGMSNAVPYCATKAAVRSFARSMSAELLERQIRVNAIAPGLVETPAFGKFGLPAEMIPQAKEGFKQLTPLKRAGTTVEIAKAAVFLGSNDSSFILGEEIVVDGGMIGL